LNRFIVAYGIDSSPKGKSIMGIGTVLLGIFGFAIFYLHKYGNAEYLKKKHEENLDKVKAVSRTHDNDSDLEEDEEDDDTNDDLCPFCLSISCTGICDRDDD